jgi:hypothetical protein
MKVRFRRLLKTLVVAAFLGLALGYSTFYFLFPNVSVPAAEEASLPVILGLLVLAAILAGLVTEELPSGMVQAIASVPIGILVAFLLAVSPALTGLLEVRADEMFSFVGRLGSFLYLLAVPVYIIFGVVGLLIRERFGFQSASFLRGRLTQHK